MKKSNELFNTILGLDEPWEVERVDLSIEQNEVTIYVKYNSNKGICPECQQKCDIYDIRESRKWRHLDTCQLKTYIVASLPRIKCHAHKVKTISVPWAESNQHFSYLFESYAIEFLQATLNQTKVSRLLRISFSQINTIMKRAVNRGLKRRSQAEIEYLGIDEKSMKKGHNYMTILYDLQQGVVLDAIEGRKEESAIKVMQSVKESNHCDSLKAVSMDMWKAYINSSKAVFPDVDIVHDKFHLMKYLNEGVDKTRRKEASKLYKVDDNSLKHTKYLFLKNTENMTAKQSLRFEEVKSMNLETCKAWAIKENFKEFFNCTTINKGKFFFNAWYNDVKESGLKYMIEVSDMIARHWNGIISYLRHKITNSLSENINGRIQQIKTIARGFRAFENYRVSILFYLGNLDMSSQGIL
ncbi:MAG: ISL3 family transposase [Candidatus Cloacimonetes bacterium]|nr:ISL3 family transposase [Candidatus Cloacimonadota bacterium]